MTMIDQRDYARTLTIDTPRERVFDAVATLEGLAGWWTTLVDGRAEPGGEITFRFEGLDEQIVMRVDEARTPELLVWTCLEHSGHPEWEGTRVAFEIEELNEGSLLRFRHDGLLPTLDCYDVCESGWERFLASIADYAESGKGNPF
jgi:uncharacterized protein YndB with AHSA1/START domain